MTKRDLTHGPVTSAMLLFAAPMIAGNLLQQLYNVADTLIVGQFLGAGALAAVGSSYTVMVFITSILLGLCMGSGILFSMLFGAKREEELRKSCALSFVLIGALTVLLQAAALLFTEPLLQLLQIPQDVFEETQQYIQVVFWGMIFTFLYNYFASLLRAMGNSMVPLLFLAVSALLNIGMDLLFVLNFHMGVAGAAWATVLAQAVSAVGIAVYSWKKMPEIHPKKGHFVFDRQMIGKIAQYSLLTCIQQSVMNFGILLVQGLVNSFGVTVMAAFAAAVKIDSFAYMPVQDFGNAFSTFIAQNHGAGKPQRIRRGIRAAVVAACVFCIIISLGVCMFGEQLMLLFVHPDETEIIAIGVQYLFVEGACYCGIGCLFLLYGLYRGLGRPGISVILTVISLGTRVALAYILAPIPSIGLLGIWWAIPIGWFLADAAGFLFYRVHRKKLIPASPAE
jgi:putative MATE family efflux protein